MKICILTTTFPLCDGNPIGIFILEQARHLNKLGGTIKVIAPHHPGALKDEIMDNISVHRFAYVLPEKYQILCYGSGIPDNLKKNGWIKFQLPLLLIMFFLQAIRHARDCDIIHAHWSIAGLAGFFASKILRKPIVLTMHHGTIRTLSGIEKFLLEHVDYVLCNSTFTLSHILDTAKPKAIKVVPPGVDMQTFRPQPQPSVTRYNPVGIPENHLILLTMGRLVPVKGHACLIDAIALLPQDAQCHLLIGGDGMLRQELEGRAREKGVSDKVTFLGNVPNHLTPKYYTMADIFIQPSIVDKHGNTEGLGVALIEAMACGTPCIGSRVGGITDIIIDGENGFLTDPSDPAQLANRISVLLKDSDLRMKIGYNGRRSVLEKYSWNAKAKEHMDIFYSLIYG